MRTVTRGGERKRRTVVTGALLLAVTAGSWGLRPGIVDAGPPGGVLAEPDGDGVRVQLEFPGLLRYRVIAHPDRVVVTLDGVVGQAATYRLAVGSITGISLRPAAGQRPATVAVITTREPVEIVGHSLEGDALVIRLAPRGAGRAAPAGREGSGPGGHSPGSLSGRDLAFRSIRVEAGTGRLLQVEGVVRVAVSDPQVLGVVPISSRELLVNGRAEGRTTMYVWGGNGRVLAYTVDVFAAVDRLAGLRRLLGTLLPDAAITVTEVPASGSALLPGAGPPTGDQAIRGEDSPRQPADYRTGQGSPGGPSIPQRFPAPGDAVPPAGGAGPTIVLTGMVPTQLDRQKAQDIARAFAPVVVNLLDVSRPIQLRLEVKVLELSRTALRMLGVTWGGGQQVPGAPPSFNGGVYNLQVITSPGVGTNGLDLLIAQIQALAQTGEAKVLAEPNLVVLAGRSASLLLGGQVPIPVSGPNSTVTIEYKDFGVILTAHPDYQEDGRIFMQITPEVSTLDFADAIKVNGFTIPALRVRRAQTVVSMLPTQTLVLGGMLQHQDSELIQKIPLLGDLPIIGPLFRSKSFQHQETDLVIFVTPVRIEPASAPPGAP